MKKSENMVDNYPDFEGPLVRSLHLLKETQTALEQSENIYNGLNSRIQENWGCSKGGFIKKMESIFGSPSEADMFVARKIFEEKFKQDNPSVSSKIKRTFIVNNPI
ncbi:hypothetical protein TDB9533_04593 [Thalassocella blandensis]|nr:hypothetical protein TDB9533_04593 [Thalassocella blandensis]